MSVATGKTRKAQAGREQLRDGGPGGKGVCGRPPAGCPHSGETLPAITFSTLRSFTSLRDFSAAERIVCWYFKRQ